MPRTIYQLINYTAEEIYVGMTGDDAETRYRALAADPPPSLSRWTFGTDEIKVDTVDKFENDEDGVAFFKGFWHSLSHSRWKTVHCDEDCIDTGDPGPCDMNCDAVRKDKQGH